jgi:apolipoprotein N-acyltransferase
VAVVQPNIAEHIKLDPATARDSTLTSLSRLMPRIAPGSVDLVVLPEVTLSVFPRAPAFSGELDPIQLHSREIGAPIIFGALGYEARSGGEYVPYNSAFLMRPRGLADYQYDKRYLVPIVERVPFAPARVFGAARYLGSYGVGRGWPLAESDETRFGVLICYESTYPEGARAFRLAGADVLVNITNDAWYGREPLYARTTALWQHPAHLVMRAIENRMGVARAANTGISLFVDPVGRVHSPTGLFVADVRVDSVTTTDTLTFYSRHGDLIGRGCALGTLLLVLGSVYLSRRHPSLDPSSGLI